MDLKKETLMNQDQAIQQLIEHFSQTEEDAEAKNLAIVGLIIWRNIETFEWDELIEFIKKVRGES